MEPQRPQSTRRRDLSLLVQSSFASVSSVISVANAFVGISKNETATTGSHRAHREHREKLGMSLFLEPKSFSVSSVATSRTCASVANAFVGISKNETATTGSHRAHRAHREHREKLSMSLFLEPKSFSVSSVISVARSLELGSTWLWSPYHRYSVSIPPLRDLHTTRTWSAYHRYATLSQPEVEAESTWGGRRVNRGWDSTQLGSEPQAVQRSFIGRRPLFARRAASSSLKSQAPSLLGRGRAYWTSGGPRRRVE